MKFDPAADKYAREKRLKQRQDELIKESKFPGKGMQDNYSRYLDNKTKEAPLPADYTFVPKVPKRMSNEAMA